MCVCVYVCFSERGGDENKREMVKRKKRYQMHRVQEVKDTHMRCMRVSASPDFVTAPRKSDTCKGESTKHTQQTLRLGCSSNNW